MFRSEISDPERRIGPRRFTNGSFTETCHLSWVIILFLQKQSGIVRPRSAAAGRGRAVRTVFFFLSLKIKSCEHLSVLHIISIFGLGPFPIREHAYIEITRMPNTCWFNSHHLFTRLLHSRTDSHSSAGSRSWKKICTNIHSAPRLGKTSHYSVVWKTMSRVGPAHGDGNQKGIPNDRF